MRGLSVLDMLVILTVLALLVYAGSREFAGYEARTIPVTTPAAAAK